MALGELRMEISRFEWARIPKHRRPESRVLGFPQPNGEIRNADTCRGLKRTLSRGKQEWRSGRLLRSRTSPARTRGVHELLERGKAGNGQGGLVRLGFERR